MPPRHTRSEALLVSLLLAACGPAPSSTDATGSTGGESSDATGSTTSATGEGTDVSSSGDSSGTSDSSTSTTSDPGTSEPGTSDATTEPATESESSGTGCPFVCELDMPLPELCDPWAQDCGEGMKCTFFYDPNWGSFIPSCVPVRGDGQHGDPCTVGAEGHDNCAKGGLCWNANEEGEGTCVLLCYGTPDNPMCPEGTTCQGGRDLVLCIDNCDPLLEDCPNESDVCIPNPNGVNFTCVLDASEDAHPPGTPCEYANACNSGSFCANV
ncbi:MAG: hypothetical protein KC636_37270, partial [Myxococcales bacterium]|nr:hypothetical protein [Myxococcales bacterium]